MSDHKWFAKRHSATPAPDYSGKHETLAFLKKKKTPTEADYKPASANARERCSECKFYLRVGQPESDCSKIIGIVQAVGTCDLFSQRDYAGDAPVNSNRPKTEIVIRLG